MRRLSQARLISGVLIAAGIFLCTISDIRPSRPASVHGYYVLGADFHVHTAFGDGGLAPWDAARDAQRRGIDVIAVTNHNQMLAARIHRRLFGDAGLPLVLMGQEVTAPHHHILAIGVRSVVDWNQAAAATIADIHTRGGVAIAAHPHGESARDYGDEALQKLDAVERAHPGMYLKGERRAAFASFFARVRQHHRTVSPVGDSDFHFTGAIGFCRTDVLAREISETAVLDAVRNGRTVAYDRDGNAFGEPEYIAIAEQGGKVRRSAAPSRWAAVGNAIGVSAVWFGLAGLVLLGTSGRSNS